MGHLGRSHYIGVHSPFVVFPTTNVISSVLHGDQNRFYLFIVTNFNCDLNVVANFAHHRMFSPQLLFVRTIQTVIDQTRRRSNSHLDVSFFMPTIIVQLPSDKIKNSHSLLPFPQGLSDHSGKVAKSGFCPSLVLLYFRNRVIIWQENGRF